jgi:hypothetical protein
MTIKINVGVNKKIGLPDYGSAGSHCNIEIEADNSVLQDTEQFLQRVKDAYEVARQSVEEELAHHRPNDANQYQRDPPQQQQQRQEYRQNYSNNDYSSASSNGIASAKQQQFIASLVKDVKGLDWRKLDKYCDNKFGKACSQLSPKEASALIQDLKAAKSGERTIAV